MSDKNVFNICLVSFPTGFSGVHNIFLNDLVKILRPSCESLYLLTNKYLPDDPLPADVTYIPLGISLHKKGTIKPAWLSGFLQVFKILLIQLKISWHILKLSKKTDIVFFYLGGADVILPIICAKILHKKVITSVIGQYSKTEEMTSGKSGLSLNSVIVTVYTEFEKCTYKLSDRILVESPGVISFLGIERFREKIFTSGIRYINTTVFRIGKKYQDRKKIIGFRGRFDEQKGILNFISAIPLLLKIDSDLVFYIGGEGHLLPTMVEMIEKNNLKERVTIFGWDDNRQNVADFLNELKVLVLPSVSEGVPTIMLEAMACGTPIVATRVGGIPDIIHDGLTGILIEDNSPESITKGVIRCIENPGIEKMIIQNKQVICSDYTMEGAILRYKQIIK